MARAYDRGADAGVYAAKERNCLTKACGHLISDSTVTKAAEARRTEVSHPSLSFEADLLLK